MEIYENDEYERRMRLVSLAYEVLQGMKTPPEKATDEEMLSLLSRAFFEKATAFASLAAAAPRARERQTHKPTFVYSTRDRMNVIPTRRLAEFQAAGR